MSRGTDDNVTTIDHTPQWAKGGENLLQQPWFVPSAVEVRWLYTHNTPLLLDRSADNLDLGNGPGSSRELPFAITLSTAGGLLSLDGLPDGSWIHYAGPDADWATTSSGIWPLWTSPNYVKAQRNDGTWYRRERTPADGPPVYSWEQFRKYLKLWGLPVNTANAHRNGRESASEPSLNSLGYIKYPEPDAKGAYSLHPRVFHALEKEFATEVDPEVEVVRVHPFPYRLTVEMKDEGNSDYKYIDKTRLQDMPWGSLQPKSPPRRSNRHVAAELAAELLEVEQVHSNDASKPPTAAPIAPRKTKNERNRGKRTEDAKEKDGASDKAAESTTPGSVIEISEGQEHDTDAHSPLNDAQFKAADGTVFPGMDEILEYPKSRKLRTAGKRWRQQHDRRNREKTKDAPAAYSEDEIVFLRSWRDSFGILFHLEDLATLFNKRFGTTSGRPERTAKGLAHKYKRMSLKSTTGKVTILKPAANNQHYISLLKTWKEEHEDQSADSLLTQRKRKSLASNTEDVAESAPKRRRDANAQTPKPSVQDGVSEAQVGASRVTRAAAKKMDSLKKS